jgi:carboxylesterase
MGALLAIHVARRRPADVAALVLLAPSLRFKTVEAHSLAIVSRVARLAGVAHRVSVPKLFGADVRDVRIRGSVPTLRTYPLQALATLSELMGSAAADLPYVQAPVLLVHGRYDRTVPRAVVDEVAAGIGSRVCDLISLERSGHLVALDYDRDRLRRAVLNFLSTRGRAT